MPRFVISHLDAIYASCCKNTCILGHLIMKAVIFIQFACTLLCINAHPDPISGYVIEEPIYYDTFPEDFIWGAATAAYQVS